MWCAVIAREFIGEFVFLEAINSHKRVTLLVVLITCPIMGAAVLFSLPPQQDSATANTANN